MKHITRFAVVIMLCLLIGVTAHAQSVAPTGTWEVGAGYSSVAGPTSNGQRYFVGKQLGNRTYAVAKVFTLANPSGVVMVIGSPRYQLPFSAFWKPNGYFDSSKLALNLDANLGAVKDNFGTSRFAYGAGIGLDYRIASNVTINAFEVDYVRSKLLPTGSTLIIVNNLNSISTGISFRFN